ncbi:MAG: hypothetical protein ABIL09_01385 [Gemmatimonadota bacterium]
MLERAAELQVNGGGDWLQIACLYDNGQLVCQFMCNGMDPDAIFGKLEELAALYEAEGTVTDEINGTTYSVH